MCVIAQRPHFSLHFYGLYTSITMIAKFPFGEVKCFCIYRQANMSEDTGHVKLKEYRLILQHITQCSWQNLISGTKKWRCELQKKPMKYWERCPTKHFLKWITDWWWNWKERSWCWKKILQLLFKGSREWNTPTDWEACTASHFHPSSMFWEAAVLFWL